MHAGIYGILQVRETVKDFLETNEPKVINAVMEKVNALLDMLIRALHSQIQLAPPSANQQPIVEENLELEDLENLEKRTVASAAGALMDRRSALDTIRR